MEQFAGNESHVSRVRQFLEELCCNLCRLMHARQDGTPAEAIAIGREVPLGPPDTFADIRVQPPQQAPYFVEVKYGYAQHLVLRHLTRKYRDSSRGASKVVLVIDTTGRADWPKLRQELQGCLCPSLQLEVWDEGRLRELVREHFGLEFVSFAEADMLELNVTMEQAKCKYAFGTAAPGTTANDGLQAQLIWHFGPGRLRQLHADRQLKPHEVFPPRHYRSVAVLMADMSAFSSYVRDTRDDEVIRHCLSSFYSKARYQILVNGGMLYQFVGDEVIGLFGVPDQPPGYVGQALQTGKDLLPIGRSLAVHWQRFLDRVQTAAGLHAGLALGDLQVVTLLPFNPMHMGCIGDVINVAARLMACAGPGEIVVSNSFYNELDEPSRAGFQELEAVEMRNIGLIKAWKWK